MLSASADLLRPVNGVSLHRQVFVLLRDEIQRGVYGDAGALPSEGLLCRRFGVSRITVRRALTDLVVERLIERRPGVGSFVRGGASQPRLMPSLTMIEGLRKTVAETQVKVLAVDRLVPPVEAAAFFRLTSGVKAVNALRLRSIADTPVMLTDAWVPLSLAKFVTATALRKLPLYEILMERGVSLGQVVQEVTAVVADPARATALGVAVGSPLLRIVRLMHDDNEQPVEYLTVYLNGARSRLLMGLHTDEINTLRAGQVFHDSPSESWTDMPSLGTRG